MKTNNKKYLHLINIIFLSIALTLAMTYIMEPIKDFIIPAYKNCYDLLQNIKTIDNKLLLNSIFDILYFIIYFFIFSIVLSKYLQKKRLENILSTVTFLLLFNAVIMGTIMYVNFQLKKSSVDWCVMDKDSCVFSYKILHNISDDSNISVSLKEIEPCFNDVIKYLEEADKILKEKKSKAL